MPGTSAGAAKARITNKTKYGEDYYKKIGSLGGKISKGGGFKNIELAREAGRKGGLARSKRSESNTPSNSN